MLVVKSCHRVLTMTMRAEAQQSGGISEARSPPGCTVFDHAIMNLPATAIEFLDSFHGAFDRDLWAGKLPLVHCYCFQRKDESHAGEQCCITFVVYAARLWVLVVLLHV